MESRRRNKWDNYRRSHNKRPPSGNYSWQPTVPSWEKEFCRVIGSLEWETLVQMKKFMHLYDNVIKWDDSAGEEAFCNAKKHFWAEINGLPCDISLPDPDLYIDKIDWDAETDPDLLSDLESNHMTSYNVDKDRDPVVIFGDSLFPSHAYPVTGWGDDDENFKVQTNSSSGNHMQKSFEKGAAIGWPSYYNNACQYQPPDGAVDDSANARRSVSTETTRGGGNGRGKGHKEVADSSAWNYQAAITVGQAWKR